MDTQTQPTNGENTMTTYRIRSSEFHGEQITRTGLTLAKALNSPLGCGSECSCGGGSIEDEATGEPVDIREIPTEVLEAACL